MKLNKFEMFYLITFIACFVCLVVGFAVGTLNAVEIIENFKQLIQITLNK